MRTIRTIGLLAAAVALAATGLQASAAGKKVIEDPLGDANFVNDQGTGDGSVGDFNQADAGTVSDITGVTISNDAKNLTITVETEAAPPATTGIGYKVRANPGGTGGTHCLSFEAYHPGANNVLTSPVGHFTDTCAGGGPVEFDVLGNTWIVPRKVSKALGKGKKLTGLQAQAFLYSGTYPQGVAGPVADTTKVGTDYKLVDKKKRRKKK
jgi:hypothetical protein